MQFGKVGQGTGRRFALKFNAVASVAAVWVGFMITPAAHGQLASPTSHPGASITAPTSSILMSASDITLLQTWWNTPTAGFQTTIKNSVNGTANLALAATQPTDLTTSSDMSARLAAKAVRWVGAGGGSVTHADFVAVVDRLKNYARVTGGSAITGALASRGYFEAFDLVNSHLDAYDVSLSQAPGTTRSAIITRLNGNVLNGVGTPFLQSGNQQFLNYGVRGFYASLAGNESNLDSAISNLRTAFNASTTNDGYQTDGDRYVNYFTANLSLFMNGYQNWGGDTTGAAQYKNAATQFALHALGMRMPNGTSPNFHNSDNMPVAIHEFSRLLDTTTADGKNLKAAAVWNATQINGHDWTSWSNALNNNWSYPDFMVLTDFSAGAAAPNWTPTYLSPGQARESAFRNDWSTTSHYFAMTAGVDHASAFTHHDTGDITVVANGAQVIVSSGYQRSSGDSALPNTPPGTAGSVGSNQHLNTAVATSHNVLLARNTATTTWGIGNGASQSITGTSTTMTNRMDSQEQGGFKGVLDFSTIRTSYGTSGAGSNVQERRSTGMVNESSTDKGYMVMTDSFRSTNATNKDFAVQLSGKSRAENTEIMVDNSDYKKIRWSVNHYLGLDGGTRITNNNANVPSGVPYSNAISGQVIAHVVSSTNAPMDSVFHDEWWSLDNWGSFMKTQRMRISMTNTNRGAFLTLFELGAHNFTSEWTVTPFSGPEHASARIVSTDGWIDWHISQTNTTSVIATTADAQVSIDSGALASDGQYAYLRKTGSVLDSAALSRGTNLYSDSDQLLGWSSPVTMSMLFDTGDPYEYRGTLSGDDLVTDTILTLYDALLPSLDIASATLNGIPMAFTADSVTMAGTSGGDFIITLMDAVDAAAVPEPSTWTLIVLAMAGLAVYRRRRRS